MKEENGPRLVKVGQPHPFSNFMLYHPVYWSVGVASREMGSLSVSRMPIVISTNIGGVQGSFGGFCFENMSFHFANLPISSNLAL